MAMDPAAGRGRALNSTQQCGGHFLVHSYALIGYFLGRRRAGEKVSPTLHLSRALPVKNKPNSERERVHRRRCRL